MATDIIIEYQGGIVLIERKFPPYGLALPGGHWEYGLSFEENAIKEAREETGLEVILQNPQHPFLVLSDKNRDPRYHMGTVVFIGTGSGILKAGDDAKKASVYSIDQIKDLIHKNGFAFDHKIIVQEYFQNQGV